MSSATTTGHEPATAELQPFQHDHAQPVRHEAECPRLAVHPETGMAYRQTGDGSWCLLDMVRELDDDELATLASGWAEYAPPAPAAADAEGVPSGAQIRLWVAARFGEHGPFLIAAKLAEEAGEVLGAALKREEGRTDADWAAELRCEVGDVAIVLLQLLDAEGWSLADVVTDRWQQVLARAGGGPDPAGDQ